MRRAVRPGIIVLFQALMEGGPHGQRVGDGHQLV
jgi:hypothetical protein